VAELGREIALAGAAVEGLEPDAGIGVVFSMPSRWAFEFHPPLQAEGTPPGKQGAPDRAAYERIVYRIYAGLSRAGHQVALWHAEHLLQQDPVDVAARLPKLVAAGLVLVGDELTDWFRAYVGAGGHLVLGIRTATSDDDGRVRRDRHPAGLHDLAGVHYEEFSNLLEPVPVTGLGGHAEKLVEGLIVDDAEIVAGFDHPHFGRWAALATRSVGSGRVTYLRAFPDLELATELGRWLAPEHPWPGVVDGGTVTVHGATNRSGERLWFVHNWSAAPQTVELPVHVEDVLDPGAPATSILTLGGRDVRVLREVRG
jgi:beta-galactosidase